MARILVIEDDDSFRDVLELSLTADGHTVVTASDGIKGAERFRAEPFDIVITDLLMAKGQGLDAIMILHREFPDVGVIAMSADTSRSEFYLRMTGLLGAHRVLAKPFTDQQLREAIAGLPGGKPTGPS